jgi:2-methylisocitrate lyase-like PEP mutase family enzyme
MDRTTQRERAREFRRLHESDRTLVLVNAWDAVSARLFEEAGAPAAATTSAGIAWSLGYADGEHMPRRELVEACGRICRSVRTPVTVDVERGFGRTPQEVCATVRELVELGVVGINIEDGRLGERLAPSSMLAGKISALRELAASAGVDLFINARTDTYFIPWDDPRARYEDAVRRAREYVEAGADGIFVPGLESLDEMASMSRTALAAAQRLCGLRRDCAVVQLRRAGVRRVSLGCGPLQALLAHARRIAAEALGDGTYSAMTGEMLGNGEVNALFARA